MKKSENKTNTKKPGLATVIPFMLVVLIVVVVLLLTCAKKESGTDPALQPTAATVQEPAEPTHDPNSYWLPFSDDFNRALAAQDDLGISILIAVDCSGSMSEQLANAEDTTPKYKLAAASLAEVVKFLHDFYLSNIKTEKIAFKLGMLRFAGEANVAFELTEMNEQQFTRLQTLLADPQFFSPSGKTAIGETLELGSEILAQSGTIFKSFIIITDGENTTGVAPDIVLDAIVTNLNNKSSRDFPVLTSSILISFISFDLDALVFADLNTIGARVMSAFNKDELNRSLKNLFLADIKKLEAGE